MTYKVLLNEVGIECSVYKNTACRICFCYKSNLLFFLEILEVFQQQSCFKDIVCLVSGEDS